MTRPLTPTALALALFTAAAACADDAGIDRASAAGARALTGGDPERGRVALQRYGCGGCHSIRGVAGAGGLVGPPLDGIARRAYVGGVLMNTPENLVRWIRDPRAVDSLTAMPDLDVTEEDARDIASYLYALD